MNWNGIRMSNHRSTFGMLPRGQRMNSSSAQRVNGRNAMILILLLTLTTMVASGQGASQEFYRQSLKINNAGMMVLGSWALANITIGAYGWNRYDGAQQYFHQMNLFWNGVNLAIAGFALYSNLSADYSAWDMEKILDRQWKTQRLFLINAGLDVVYMGTGWLLKRIAYKYPKQETRLTGYGNSVILQGAFLFVFDLVLYAVQRSHRMDFLQSLAFQPMEGAWGLSLAMKF